MADCFPPRDTFMKQPNGLLSWSPDFTIVEIVTLPDGRRVLRIRKSRQADAEVTLSEADAAHLAALLAQPA